MYFNKTNKKICFIITSLYKGGAERMVVRLANFMAEKLSLDVTVIIFFSSRDFYRLSPKVTFHNLNMNSPPYHFYQKPFLILKRAYYLKEYLKKNEFDKIFSFMDPVNISVILTGFPVVVSSHSCLRYMKKYTPLFFLYKLKNVKKVVSLTNEMKNDFEKFGINNTCVIPNSFGSFEEEDYSADSGLIQKKPNKPYFLAVGRYCHQKNFSMLIKAFSKTNCIKNFLLLIAGDGPQRLELTKLIECLGVQENVKLLGNQNDLELDFLYRNACATVMSSRYEGFGNVLIESLSKKTPVISTNCPNGPSNIISHRKNGLLVPLNDVIAMRDAIDLLASDDQLRQQLANFASESVQDFTIDKIAQKWLDLP